MAWKHPNDMTVSECYSEVESLESYFEMCEETGDGISSKDSIRHRLCKFKIDYFEKFGRELPLGEDVWEFMKGGHLLFAPVGCGCGICTLHRKTQEV